MLDHLEGLLVRLEPMRAVVSAGGIGFELLVPLTTSSRLREGDRVLLYTHLHISDSPRILAFSTREEREFCRDLLKVSGVGPAIAVSLLSHATLEELTAAVAGGDEKSLTRIKGVGKKTAQRIILDLKEKVGRPGAGPLLPASREEEDAAAALVALGFKEKEARESVAKVLRKSPGADAGEIIRRVLAGG